MDFTLSERETYFRDRVKAFIDRRDPPARRRVSTRSERGRSLEGASR